MYSNQEAFRNYLLYQKKYSEHTVKAYLSDLEKFSDFLKSNSICDVDHVSYVDVRNWVVSLSESNLSNTSINRKMASLKAYFKFLMRIEQISLNPLLKHKSLKEPKKIQIPFSENEMLAVLDGIEFTEDFDGVLKKTIILLLYSTGIRRAELISLKPESVDFSNQSLKVLGKRNKERIIPLTDEILSQLKFYLECKKTLKSNVNIETLFISKRGVKLSTTFVYNLINSYFGMVSAKSKKSPHVLRHTFATHLLNNGADLNSVKELLGHSSLASTQVYTHSSLAELKKVYSEFHPRNKS
ncbi:MAG: tyrosine-type recombinase/integrase [Flavobacterium sp.]